MDKMFLNMKYQEKNNTDTLEVKLCKYFTFTNNAQKLQLYEQETERKFLRKDDELIPFCQCSIKFGPGTTLFMKLPEFAGAVSVHKQTSCRIKHRCGLSVQMLRYICQLEIVGFPFPNLIICTGPGHRFLCLKL